MEEFQFVLVTSFIPHLYEKHTSYKHRNQFYFLITLIPFVCITILFQLNRCNYALRGTKMHLCYYIFKYNHFVRPITQHETSRYVHDNLWHVVYQHLKTRTEFDLFCNIALMRNVPI